MLFAPTCEVLNHLFGHFQIKLQNFFLSQPNLNAIPVVELQGFVGSQDFLVNFNGSFILLDLVSHRMLNHFPHFALILIRNKIHNSSS